MSGRHTHTDDHIKGRRNFLRQLLGLSVMPVAVGLGSCMHGRKYSHIKGSIVGANHKTGHLLRGGNTFAAPSKVTDVEVLIVGGGVSGLSANRWLKLQGVRDVVVLEMDASPGGNSISGANKISAYPWGAHYLPIPDVSNKELLDFLRSINTIAGYTTEGVPIYNEYHLCHDPEERLYINGRWQEGLVPHIGISAEDKKQIAGFFADMETFRNGKGADGLFHFCIPVDWSSTDETCRSLDNMSFDAFLAAKGYTSRYLRWYLEYCSKDDYGTTLGDTSAWAGIHYFASRRGQAANASSSAILTWPEGNAYLVNKLKEQGANNIRSNMLVHSIALTNAGVQVLGYDTMAGNTIQFNCKKVILATPQFINRRLLAGYGDRESIYPLLTYAPWVVANITVNSLPQARGVPLSWDNVIFGQESVGYVFANHQNLSHNGEGVLTYYLPLTGDTAVARNKIHQRTYNQWLEYIVADLEYAHNGIARHISNVDVWVWGHGMVRPSPGYIWSAERQRAREPIADKIFFAHTDLSGISIFEEGFYQGINAARQVIQAV